MCYQGCNCLEDRLWLYNNLAAGNRQRGVRLTLTSPSPNETALLHPHNTTNAYKLGSLRSSLRIAKTVMRQNILNGASSAPAKTLSTPHSHRPHQTPPKPYVSAKTATASLAAGHPHNQKLLIREMGLARSVHSLLKTCLETVY